MNLFLYGPPGAGKTTTGKLFANRLGRTFIDLDQVIVRLAKKTIPEIFEKEGESGFRAREREALLGVLAVDTHAVVSLGGGALLDPQNRADVERAGRVICFDADIDLLTKRLSHSVNQRPLLAEKLQGLAALLEKRKDHYASFPCRVRCEDLPINEMVDRVQVAFGVFGVSGMGNPYAVHSYAGAMEKIGDLMAELSGGKRVLLVGDSHTIPLYGSRVAERIREAGFQVTVFEIPAGEAGKTLETVQRIWSAALRAGIERTDWMVALGGGVVGDLTGFAASTWLRGVKWIVVPTTLLSMVDSSLGGKTGADLPEGKNLIGAFYPPSLVVTDPVVLSTLPARELRCGMAEAIKHAVLPCASDALRKGLQSFSFLRNAEDETTFPQLRDAEWLAPFVSWALSVKVQVIDRDPFETKGIRASLNLGHTIGHGVEKASHFTVHHGEAVAMGMVAAARIARRMPALASSARQSFADELCEVLTSVGLPVEIPDGICWRDVLQAVRLDKKKKDGIVRFVLPLAWGSYEIAGVPDEVLTELDSSLLRKTQKE